MTLFRLLVPGVVVAGFVLLVPSRPAARLADPQLVSTWSSTPPAIDGSVADWVKLDSLEHGPAVALQNDADSLYLAVVTSDPEIRRQLATGLVVWFDPKSKKEQGSGLRIDGLARRLPPGAEPDGSGAQMDRAPSMRTIEQFDWLGPVKNQRKLVDLTPALGVAIASGTAEGVLVYEITLPLQSSAEHPYAVGATPGSTIAIGIETPSAPSAREGRGRDSSDGAARGGGMGGSGGGRMGRGGGGTGQGGMPPRGGGRGDFMGQPVKPMKLVWISVKLASGN